MGVTTASWCICCAWKHTVPRGKKAHPLVHETVGDNGRNVIIMQTEDPEHLDFNPDQSEGANGHHGQTGVHISVAMGVH